MVQIMDAAALARASEPGADWRTAFTCPLAPFRCLFIQVEENGNDFCIAPQQCRLSLMLTALYWI
jgi:hypothetical protein